MKSDGDNRPRDSAAHMPQTIPDRQAFILTLWSLGDPPLVRGSLEAGNGKRRYFASVEQLTVLFAELGWDIQARR